LHHLLIGSSLPETGHKNVLAGPDDGGPEEARERTGSRESPVLKLDAMPMFCLLWFRLLFGGHGPTLTDRFRDT